MILAMKFLYNTLGRILGLNPVSTLAMILTLPCCKSQCHYAESQSSINPGYDSDLAASLATSSSPSGVSIQYQPWLWFWQGKKPNRNWTWMSLNPVSTLAMILTREKFGVTEDETLSLNPVSTLAMILTCLLAAEWNHSCWKSQSSINPGYDSDIIFNRCFSITKLQVSIQYQPWLWFWPYIK